MNEPRRKRGGPADDPPFEINSPPKMTDLQCQESAAPVYLLTYLLTYVLSLTNHSPKLWET